MDPVPPAVGEGDGWKFSLPFSFLVVFGVGEEKQFSEVEGLGRIYRQDEG